MRCLVLLGGLVVLASAAGAADEAYEIGAGDTLGIVVLDQPSLSGAFKVDPEGMLTFPFLGRVKASGMSPPEVERKLTTLLSEGYLRKPRVSVTVKEFGSQVVFVTGEFQKPGPYSLGADPSLLALLTAVGDVTPSAGHEVVVVRPPAPGLEALGAGDGTEEAPAADAGRPPLPGEVPGSEVFRISLRELRAGFPERNVLLRARDTVYLPKASMVYVLGHVGRPGPYRYEEGLTVYKALLLAGGVTDRGSAKGLRIVRLDGGEMKEHRPRMDEVVLPEDTIRVPERFF